MYNKIFATFSFASIILLFQPLLISIQKSCVVVCLFAYDIMFNSYTHVKWFRFNITLFNTLSHGFLLIWERRDSLCVRLWVIFWWMIWPTFDDSIVESLCFRMLFPDLVSHKFLTHICIVHFTSKHLPEMSRLYLTKYILTFPPAFSCLFATENFLLQREGVFIQRDLTINKWGDVAVRIM